MFQYGSYGPATTCDHGIQHWRHEPHHCVDQPVVGHHQPAGRVLPIHGTYGKDLSSNPWIVQSNCITVSHSGAELEIAKNRLEYV